MTATSRSQLLRLRRGTQVRARGDGLLQVGSDPERRAVLPDTTAIRGLLHLLDHGVRSDAAEGLTRLGAVLARAGVVVAPDELTLLAQARACTPVGLDLPPEWSSVATHLLEVAGLGTASLSDCAVVLRAGPPHRSLGPIVSETPVLHLTSVDARLRLGPFTEIGRTACLECVEAHLREADPWHQGPRQGDALFSSAAVIDEVDPLLLHAALTSAVADLAAWAEGRQPLTWSATRWFDRLQQVDLQHWQAHPHCGCAWETGWGDTRDTG